MKGILAKALSDARQRQAQSGVVLVLCLLAALVATMSLTLLFRTSAPFDAAFARAQGAHLVLHLDAARVTPDQLAATERLPGVTAAGPARPIAFVPFEWSDRKSILEVVGRDSPGGDLDRPILVTGRWAQARGEIVVPWVPDIAATQQPFHPRIGDTMRALSRPERPTLRVVGEAVDMSQTQFMTPPRAWVLSDVVAGLTDAGQSRPGYEMAYRFTDAATPDALAADLAALEAALPAGAEMAAASDWLTTKQSGPAYLIGLIGAGLAAFTIFAVLAAVLVVANVVVGAVLAGYREIGIMKAVGFTPSGVSAVYMLQMLAPALLGGLVGVVLGVASGQPLLAMEAESVALPPSDPFFPPIDLGVLVGLVAVVAVASFLPALRAGRTNAVAALSVGAAPELSRLSWLGVRLQRLRAPASVRLGAGSAFARPLRSLLLVAAFAVGVAVLTAAVGFQTMLSNLLSDRGALGLDQDVTVQRFGAYPDDRVMATLAARPETEAVLATYVGSFVADGAVKPIPATAVRGDSARFGYRAIKGRWFSAPGEAVMAVGQAGTTGLQIGDIVSGSFDGHPLRLTIVGTIPGADLSGTGGLVRFDWGTYQAVDPAAEPTSYFVLLRPGADAAAYARDVQSSEPHFLAASVTDTSMVDFAANFIVGMFGALAMVLLLMALAGMFNTMLLTVRERAFEFAVLKGLGMTPRQVIAMVATSAALLAIVGAALGLPAGLVVHAVMLQAMADYTGARGFAGLGLGDFGPFTVVWIVGVAIMVALAGSALPARWAARLPAAQLMHAE